MSMRGLEITECQVSLAPSKPESGPLAAFARIVFNDALVLNGIRIIEGKFGPFISFPREESKSREGKAYNICYPIRREVQEGIQAVIITAYRDALLRVSNGAMG